MSYPLPLLSIEMDMELYASDAFPMTTIPDTQTDGLVTMQQYRRFLVTTPFIEEIFLQKASAEVPIVTRQKRLRSAEGNGPNKMMKVQ